MESLSEVLETSSNDKSIDINKSRMKTFSEIRRHRCIVKDYIETTYGDFLPTLTNNMLLVEGLRLILEAETFLENLESSTKSQLQVASLELNSHIEDFEELIVELKGLQKVLQIEKLFEKIEESKSFDQCLETMLVLDDVKTLIDDPTDIVLSQLQCYLTIKVQYQYELEVLLHSLKTQFEEMVQFTEKSFHSSKVITVRIQKDYEKLRETVIALHKAQYNPRKLCNFLLENILEPIICKPIFLEKKDEENFIEVKLSYSLAEVGDELRPNYKIVFSNLKAIFEVLSFIDVQITNTLKLFNILKIMRKDLHDMVLVVDGSQSDPHDHTVFPRCMVSKSIQSLIAFLEKITEQFISRFKEKRELLVSTIELILNRYLVEVPQKDEAWFKTFFASREQSKKSIDGSLKRFW